jgi:hypothetical protein
MFDRFKTFLAPLETKASRTAKLLAFESGGRARWTPRDYAALAREGYSAKPYVLFYTTKRVGGGVQDFDAIKLMKFAAS